MASSSWPTKTYNASSTSINGLQIPFSAFVHPYNGPTLSVVVRSDSQPFLDVLAFEEKAGKALVVKFSDDNSKGLNNVEVSYLIDVFVPVQSLASIVALGSGEIVVTPNALVNSTSDALDLAVTGSGSIFVSGPSIALDDLKLSASGSGNVQFDVPTTTVAKKVEASVTGSGALVLATTSLKATSLETSITGHGKVYVASAAANISSTVKTSIAGSGALNIYTAGSCAKHDITVAGSGAAYVSAMRCADTSVAVMGSGSAYVASTTSLATSVSGSGQVNVVGTVPGWSGATTGTPRVDMYTLEVAPKYSPKTTTFLSHASIGSTSSNATVVGVVAGVAVLVLLVVGVLVYKCRKNGRACFRASPQQTGYTRRMSTEGNANAV
ncbi:hypothetical protein ACHHYP_07796 [Achlya hypogyna]|uniref:Putative auto-transporter adhesin head GIN domain-containing protein n=1 Tax=Achlya hypogyna TaxID=1202772 RepID=A0A1V9YQF6_ACHHY|nr:hypothetical protein ACHHYP_07796 [Achlya hypogyna]